MTCTVQGGIMNYMFGLVLCATICGALSKRYGGRREGRIVGGFKVISIDMYPYQAYLLLQKGSEYSQCGGSIVSDRAIVTAAHCMTGVQRAFIRIGSVHSNRGGLEYQSSNFRIHPRFGTFGFDYDIAVIRLSRPMELDGWNTRAVKLPQMNAAIPEDTLLEVSGWGYITEDGPTSVTLRSVTVPALSNEQCKQQLRGITSRMVCAGIKRGGKDSCQGDSGGPAVDKNTKVLLGVVSYGDGCARPGLPGVYASVPALRHWIYLNAGV